MLQSLCVLSIDLSSLLYCTAFFIPVSPPFPKNIGMRNILLFFSWDQDPFSPMSTVWWCFGNWGIFIGDGIIRVIDLLDLSPLIALSTAVPFVYQDCRGICRLEDYFRSWDCDFGKKNLASVTSNWLCHLSFLHGKKGARRYYDTFQTSFRRRSLTREARFPLLCLGLLVSAWHSGVFDTKIFKSVWRSK